MSEIEQEIRRQLEEERRRTALEEEIRRQMLAERPPASNGAGTAAESVPKKPSKLHHWQSQGGVIGAIATILFLVAKFWAPILLLLKQAKILLLFAKFGKVFITGGSMLISMWFYALSFGWPMGIGLVMSIFIHECGHAWAGWRRGIPMSGMVFIPFMGAAVLLKRGGKNVGEDAYIGIMGPVWGTASGLLCLLIHLVAPSQFWLVMAYIIFWMNLFNLAPVAPLDGGWIVPVFSPKLLALGVVLLFILAPRNPMIWLLALMSIPRIIGGWKADPKTQPYYQVTGRERWTYGFAYLGLAALLGYLSVILNSEISALRHLVA